MRFTKGKGLKHLRAIACIGLAVSAVGIAGCASHKDEFRTSGQYKEDQDVANNVKNALEQAPVYKYPDVKVTAYRGRVQLSGFVATEAQKAEATRIASRVQGVAQVDNSLLLKETPTGAETGGATAPGGGSTTTP